MRTRFFLFIAFASFVVCLPLLGQSQVLTKTNDFTDKLDSHALEKAWLMFANAVRAGDKSAIRELSTSRIDCVDCLTNTPEEEVIYEELRQMHPDTWYEEMYRQLCYINIGKFMSEDLSIIFDETTKARLLDSSKLAFANNGQNKGLYENQCIIKAAQRHNAKYIEVLVTVIDPSPKCEGFQKAFAFVKIGNSYKFCGYSTIP